MVGVSWWRRFRTWRLHRAHDALRAQQRAQGLYILDEFAPTPIARGVGGLSPASALLPPIAPSRIDYAGPEIELRMSRVLDEDRRAVMYALSTIASWSEWCSTGGPSLSDACDLILQRVHEAREKASPDPPGTRMDMIGADMEPNLGARKAARKWASSEKAADERPHLSGMVLRLCDEHAQMERSLRKIAAGSSPSDPWSEREAKIGLRGVES